MPLDDLVDRALQRQDAARTSYNNGLKRLEVERQLTESPAFLGGYSNGHYSIERLGQDPVSVGVPVTNGYIAPGDRVTMTGQYVDAVPRMKTTATTTAKEITGKVQILYTLPGSSQLFIGGFSQNSIKVPTYPSAYGITRFENWGGNKYVIQLYQYSGTTPGSIVSFKTIGQLNDSYSRTLTVDDNDFRFFPYSDAYGVYTFQRKTVGSVATWVSVYRGVVAAEQDRITGIYGSFPFPGATFPSDSRKIAILRNRQNTLAVGYSIESGFQQLLFTPTNLNGTPIATLPSLLSGAIASITVKVNDVSTSVISANGLGQTSIYGIAQDSPPVDLSKGGLISVKSINVQTGAVTNSKTKFYKIPSNAQAGYISYSP